MDPDSNLARDSNLTRAMSKLNSQQPFGDAEYTCSFH